MFDSNHVFLGIAPIGWCNDDMPELGGENTFQQTVSEMALAGFTGCEIGNKYPKDPAELKKALDLRGMRIASRWYSSFLLTRPFEEEEKDFIANLDFLAAVGANRINVSEQSYSIQGKMDVPVLTGGHKHVMDDAEWKLLCDGLNKLGKIAADRGFKLCFHHHMGTVVQTSEETDRMMANTDPRYVFLCYDTGHFTFAGEDPLAMLKKYVDRVGHVHLKDMRLPVVEEAPWSIRGALMALAALSLLLGLAPWAPLTLVIPVASACFAPASMDLVVLQSVMAPWPIYVAVPVFGALLPAFFRRNPIWAARSSAFVLLLTAALVIFLGRDLDTLSYCFALIVPLIGALNVFYAQGYMSHSHTQWRFYCAFTAMCGGLVGISASTYLFQFFLFWEIMSSWTLYMAIAHEGDKASLREAFKYFFFNVLGAGFIFVGVCVLGPATPFSSESMQHLTKLFLLPGWVVWGGTALLAIGFVMKAAQLPFRIDWQMHPALAPTPVSGYISSVLLKSSILGLIKLFMLMGGSLAMIGVSAAWPNELIQTVVMWIGGITIVMAATQALLVNNVKLVFIYSTVSQIGYMVLAVAAGGALGYAGGMLHVVNHVFFKDLLFLVCGAVMFATHADSLDDLGGIGRKMPFTLCMFAIAGLSVVGVPPTSGFSSKWIIYHALMQADQPFLALLSLVGSVLTLAYIAKFLHAAFLGQPSKHLDHVQEAPLTMRVPMAILAIGCIITGIFPGLMLWPINAILGDYNAGSLVVGLSGLQEGPGAWNATGLSVMMAIAAAAGWYFVRRFVVLREVDVHTCGLPTEVATSRMAPSGIYGGLVRRLAWFPGNTSVDNKS